ncbi:Ankyrin repeat-containing domain protein [Akanthomyces lecanii RCEF 1005]|uniref:Ankyrin repeat-containing domain protein n=1 Tax=Akanthomyces lecanii RCEF 1005 TaxID=1081108 RepID=A0A168KQP1_CORDF|nr:Ankyrin repeat-containing domain protein [Akanthomyces lecanii RCEF 1005]
MERQHQRKSSKVKDWLFRSRSKSPQPEPLTKSQSQGNGPKAEDKAAPKQEITKSHSEPTQVAAKADVDSKGASPGAEAEKEGDTNPPPYNQATPELDLWEEARNALGQADRDLLEKAIGNPGQERNLQDVLQEVVRQKQQLAEEKAWKFEFGGRRIVLRDVVEKIVSWINVFKSLGDIASSADPIHAGIPWAVIRVVLQVATADVEQNGQILVAVELATSIMNRGKIYEGLYLSPGHMSNGPEYAVEALRDLQKGITRMYSQILSIMISYVKMMETGTVARAFKAALDPSHFSGMMADLGKLEDRCEMAANNCERHVSSNSRNLQDANFRKLREMLKEHMERNTAQMSRFWKKLDDEDRCKVFLWLSDVPYETDHYNATKGRVEGTGQWLLDNGKYHSWRNAKSSTVLWLNGIPGAGKTKLSSKVIDDILGQSDGLKSSNNAFAYFYCDRNRTDHRDPVVVLRSLVRQLSSPKDESSIIPYIEAKYTDRKRSGFSRDRLTTEECHSLLLQLTRDHSQTTIAIDGLDECDRDTRYVLMDTLDDIVAKATQTVKIYIASRQDQDLRDRYQTRGHLEVTANDNQSDIEKFVLKKMEQSEFCRTKLTKKVRQDVLRTFQEKSQGMFQWAALHIDELLKLNRNKDISAYLDKLPRGLEAAYHKIFSDINAQAGSKRDVALAVFKILMCSWRPLSPEEMVIAATQFPSETFCLDPDVDIAYIRDACHNFMVVADGLPEASAAAEQQEIEDDKEAKKPKVQYSDAPSSKYRMRVVDETASKPTYSNAICRFSHLSVREYLELHHWSIAEANAFVACICLRTILRLSRDELMQGELKSKDDEGKDYSDEKKGDYNEERDFEECPVLNVKVIDKDFYRQVVWHDSDDELESVNAEEDDAAYSHGDSALDSFATPPFRCFVSLKDIHYHEYESACTSVELDAYLDNFRYSALERWTQYASEAWSLHIRRAERHESLLGLMDSLLKEFLGEPGSSSIAYRAWTAFGLGGLNLTMADPESAGGLKSQFPRTKLRPSGDPVIGAALLGLGDSLNEWLVDGRADANATNLMGESLLLLATAGRHVTVIEALLKHGADPNVMGHNYTRPLQAAVMAERLDIVQLLLDHHADPNLPPAWQSEKELQGYPLAIAASRGNLKITRALLNSGADITESKALGIAAEKTQCEVLAMLLQAITGSDNSAPEWSTKNAILSAWIDAITKKASVEVLELVSKHGVDLTAADSMHVAAEHGNTEAIEWLSRQGMDVDQRSAGKRSRSTPLIHLIAGRIENEETISEPLEMLLNLGANVNATDTDLNTPVWFAAESSRSKILQRLLEAGARLDTKNKHGQSPLVGAIQQANASVVKVLVNHGADVNEVYNLDDGPTTPIYMTSTMEKEAWKMAHVVGELVTAGAKYKVEDMPTAVLERIAEPKKFEQWVVDMLSRRFGEERDPGLKGDDGSDEVTDLDVESADRGINDNIKSETT